MTDAPFHSELSDGPDGGRAVWLHASDGVRIRVGHWPMGSQVLKGAAQKADVKGTVLMFPGRTEYIEKYGRAASEFAARGYEMVAIDWRGQGLADRLLNDPMTGHVSAFSDYQKDVDALLIWAHHQDLPKPWYMIGHSMGGAIGMQALFANLPVNAVAFSAPMWGIQLHPITRAMAGCIAGVARVLGLSHHYAPGTKPVSYVLDAEFDDNMLTTDPEMWAYMQDHIREEPLFGLGGPSINWVGASLAYCRAILERTPPALPVVTFLGSQERIVDVPSIHRRMNNWPTATLDMIEGAEHEVMMEKPETRKAVFDAMVAHFDAHP
ncbi:alpha/beta fold hydrolase [Halocynthiibacter namhaensis]|uniref:alpha/beta fold hydrolase n=1 Tax=Halocynthiibacter namhaensis TaxID=1290553 RepID=UPI0005790EC2|nr:alpha/beta hydrolase [Halocynthiibacter namhaensis]